MKIVSFRTAEGAELLVARVETPEGRVGEGCSFTLDATEARHMAEWRAGVRDLYPRYGATASESSLPRPPGSSGATR